MRTASALAVAVLAAVSLAAAVRPAAAYQIGHTSIVYNDPARANRQIPAEIFYPAVTSGEDVPIAPPPDGGFPVLAFGHGYLIPWSDYSFVWEGLVPEGFVTVLPNTEGGLFPSHLDLGLDLALLADRVRAEGAAPGSPFYGAIAATAAVAGHSMGGGASFLAADANPTITALANLAAAETSPSAIEAAPGINAPALVFSGSFDCVTPPEDHQLPMYGALASDCKTWVSVTGGSHCQFADYNFLCAFGETGCPDPGISRSAQQSVTLQLLTPWLTWALRDDPAAWNDFQARLAGLGGITSLQDCAPTAVNAGEELAQGRTPGSARAEPRLLSVTPNPARGSVQVRFDAASAGFARLEVLSLDGRRIRTLASGRVGAGPRLASWDGRDEHGREVGRGVYLCRLRVGESTAARRMIWLAP